MYTAAMSTEKADETLNGHLELDEKMMTELVMETMFGDAAGVEEAYPVSAGREAEAPSTSSAAKAFPNGPQHWATRENVGAAGAPLPAHPTNFGTGARLAPPRMSATRNAPPRSAQASRTRPTR